MEFIVRNIKMNKKELDLEKRLEIEDIIKTYDIKDQPMNVLYEMYINLEQHFRIYEPQEGGFEQALNKSHTEAYNTKVAEYIKLNMNAVYKDDIPYIM
jgi:hypothetical protein